MAKNTKKESRPVGRPLIIDETVVAKLEAGATMGFNDSECCLYADISRSCFYDYVKLHPDFSDRLDHLRDSLKMQAKAVVARAIDNGSRDDAKWYLERKARNEFSTRQETDTTATINIEFGVPLPKPVMVDED